MARTIEISTEVFAGIWSLRGPGEESEDAILRRVLKLFAPNDGAGKSEETHAASSPAGTEGIPEGLEIFRAYKGKEYGATRASGQWILGNTGRAFRSLNELSRAVGPKTENAWRNWFFVDHEGRRHPVTELRKPDEIARRPRILSTVPSAVRQVSAKSPSSLTKVTWRDDVRSALEHLNGRANLSTIYKKVREIRKSAGRSTPTSFEEVVRRTLEENSSDSEVYRGGPDLFSMPEGKGAGFWALR